MKLNLNPISCTDCRLIKAQDNNYQQLNIRQIKGVFYKFMVMLIKLIQGMSPTVSMFFKSLFVPE